MDDVFERSGHRGAVTGGWEWVWGARGTTGAEAVQGMGIASGLASCVRRRLRDFLLRVGMTSFARAHQCPDFHTAANVMSEMMRETHDRGAPHQAASVVVTVVVERWKSWRWCRWTSGMGGAGMNCGC